MKTFDEFLAEHSVQEDFGVGRAMSTVFLKGSYKKALKVLKDLIKKDTTNRHDDYYHAGKVAQQFKGVDARKLVDMLSEDDNAY